MVSEREKIWRQRFQNILHQRLSGMPPWCLTSCFPAPSCRVAPMVVSSALSGGRSQAGWQKRVVPVPLKVWDGKDKPFSLRCWPWCSLAQLVALRWLQSLLYTTRLGAGTDGSGSASAQLAPLDPSGCCDWGMRMALGEVKWGSSSTCPSRGVFCVLSFHLVPASRHFPPSTHLFSRDGSLLLPFYPNEGQTTRQGEGRDLDGLQNLGAKASRSLACLWVELPLWALQKALPPISLEPLIQFLKDRNT